MRGLAALYVMLTHVVSMIDPGLAFNNNPASPRLLAAFLKPFTFGHLAVAAFIVISGFCLQYALFGSQQGRLRSPKRFFTRRALRILPAYYACLLISLMVSSTITPRFANSMPFSTYGPVTTDAIVSHFFLVHNLSVGWMYKINGVLWSIAVEAQLYLLFPMLVASISRYGRRVTIIGAGVLALAGMLLIPGATKLYFWYLPLFAIGMAAAHLAYRPDLKRGTRPQAAWSICIAALVLTCLASAGGLSLVFSDLAVGLAVAAMMYAQVVAPGSIIERILSLRPLFTLGTFSYSLYLIHSPIQIVLWSLKPKGWNSSLAELLYLLLIAVPIIIATAWGFGWFFERPFIPKANGAGRMPTSDRIITSMPLRVYTSEPSRA